MCVVFYFEHVLGLEKNFLHRLTRAIQHKVNTFLWILNFVPKFWGSRKNSCSIFFFGSDFDNAFSKTKNDECDLKVNRFQKWIQPFWTSLNQNSAFSRSNNIHHFPHHYKEMLQLEVCDMPILLWTFFHINDQHLETFCFRLKSEYSPLVFFPVISRLKRFALIAIFLFFFRPDFQWVDFFLI